MLHVTAATRHHAPPPSDRTWEEQPGAGQPHFQGLHGAGHQAAEQGGLEAAAGGQPTVAVFYSISATQRGLTGVDLGNFLIKQARGGSGCLCLRCGVQRGRPGVQRCIRWPGRCLPSSTACLHPPPAHQRPELACPQVAHAVQAEFPSVQTLCTLSPLPGAPGLAAGCDHCSPFERFELCIERDVPCFPACPSALQALQTGCACSWHVQRSSCPPPPRCCCQTRQLLWRWPRQGTCLPRSRPPQASSRAAEQQRSVGQRMQRPLARAWAMPQSRWRSSSAPRPC